jgi:putative FmdB family regulatory protein
MPTYEYKCTDSGCNHTFELFQSIKSRPTRKCPACGKKCKRLIGAGAGLIFRGSGFYITDYRSKDYQQKASAEKGGSCASSTCSKSGSDNKSEKPTTSAAAS